MYINKSHFVVLGIILSGISLFFGMLGAFAYTNLNQFNTLFEELDNRLDSVEIEKKTGASWNSTFFNSLNNSLIGPRELRLKLDSGDDGFILVDLRPKTNYQELHIIEAVNIPVNQKKEVILLEFENLAKTYPLKDIVVYCQWTNCQEAINLGQFLTSNQIYIKVLSIGFLDFSQKPETWNFETDVYKIENYFISGDLPGEFLTQDIAQPTNCLQDFLSC